MRESGQLKNGWSKFIRKASNPPKLMNSMMQNFRSRMVIKFTHSPRSRANDEDWKKEWQDKQKEEEEAEKNKPDGPIAKILKSEYGQYLIPILGGIAILTYILLSNRKSTD